jgi:hypothetical protein
MNTPGAFADQRAMRALGLATSDPAAGAGVTP